MKFDVAVVGLGAMGSAATAEIAARGGRVVAFDPFAPPHTLGSTHGHSRIIREAYYEHPLYVPLVRRAYDRWAALEQATGVQLYQRTGGLMIGPPEGSLVRGALESARAHDIAHEVLDAAALRRRFPAYRAHDGWVALLEHRAGMLFPERCIAAFHDRARARGAELRLNEGVRRWHEHPNGFTVETQDGKYEAARLVIAAGPWLPRLADSLAVSLPLEIERQLSHWFEPVSPADERFRPDRCPIALWETRKDDVFATFPDDGHGVKCGTHHAGAPTSPDAVDRKVSDEENEAARRLLEDVMPGAGGRLSEARVCLYTNTPDHHFIIDWLPGRRVLIVSPCSGHGFKFASAIGELVAQLVLDGGTWIDLSPFSLERFR